MSLACNDLVSQPPPNSERAEQKAFLSAIVQELGFMHLASWVSGVSASTHRKWLRNDPTYSRRFDKAKQDGLRAQRRLVEAKFFELVRSGNKSASRFCEQEYGSEILERVLGGENPYSGEVK